MEWAVDMRRFDEKRTLDHLQGEIDEALADALGRAVAAAHAKTQAVEAEPWIDSDRLLYRRTRRGVRKHPEIFPRRRNRSARESGPRRVRAHRAAAARARPPRPDPPHPRRSSSRQHRADRRQAGAVRRHRVQRHHRFRRRALRSRLPADGPARARFARGRPISCSTATSPRRTAPRTSTGLRRCRSSSPCAPRSAPWSRPRGWSARQHPSGDDIAKSARAYFDFARRAIAPPAPKFIAVGGLSGTGKSRLARDAGAAHRADARRRHRALGCRAQGAVRRRRDRKAARRSLYARSDRARLRRRRSARRVRILAAGHSAIVDAVFAPAAGTRRASPRRRKPPTFRCAGCFSPRIWRPESPASAAAPATLRMPTRRWPAPRKTTTWASSNGRRSTLPARSRTPCRGPKPPVVIMDDDNCWIDETWSEPT